MYMRILSRGLLFALLLACAVSSAAAATAGEAIRIGVTPVFLSYQTAFLNDWKAYLSAGLGRPVVFVQRNTYREITDLLLDEQLDFAWICGYPYLRLKAQLKLAAVPVYRGEPLYRSYLIVPSTDQTSASIADLKGKIFAYSDPDSNSGYLVPQFQLAMRGEDRRTFFAKAFFTWAHEKVVHAVANNVAHGGAVDGYIWETLQRLQPELTQRTRVVERSGWFGFPPVVARRGVSMQDFAAVQRQLLAMQDNDQGRSLLARLNIEGFVEGKASLYEGIARMMDRLEEP